MRKFFDHLFSAIPTVWIRWLVCGVVLLQLVALVGYSTGLLDNKRLNETAAGFPKKSRWEKLRDNKPAVVVAQPPLAPVELKEFVVKPLPPVATFSVEASPRTAQAVKLVVQQSRSFEEFIARLMILHCFENSRPGIVLQPRTKDPSDSRAGLTLPVTTVSAETEQATKKPMSFEEFSNRLVAILKQEKPVTPVQYGPAPQPFNFKFRPGQFIKPGPTRDPVVAPPQAAKDPNDRRIGQLHR